MHLEFNKVQEKEAFTHGVRRNTFRN